MKRAAATANTGRVVHAFKLFRQTNDGRLHPLIINKSQVIPTGEWLTAEDHTTTGFASRPGWHAVPVKSAPHLSTKGRVWCRVSLRDVKEYRHAGAPTPWYIAQQMRVDLILPSTEEIA